MKLPSKNMGANKFGLAIALVAIGSTAMGGYGLNSSGAIAAELQEQSSHLQYFSLTSPTIELAQVPTNGQTQILLYVNPNAGSDRNGNGSPQAPFKTITRAMSLLQDGKSAVIQLAPGTYSEDSGEKFPLQLRTGTIISGNETKKGGGIKILGGGNYRSPAAGKQNVAIVVANQAQIRGVTVTNRHENGYGLWIESIASAAIASNTISGNGKDGIYVGGNATPSLIKNVLVTNKASGIHITDTAQPEIKDNLVQSNAVGITVNKKAAPQLINNRISGNQDGILSQADAKPILRHNKIERNKANGMIIANNSLPDLGTANSPGNNLWGANQDVDINNTSRNPLAIVGNQVDPKRLAGTIKVVGAAAPSPANTANNPIPSNPNPSNVNVPRNTATRIATPNPRTAARPLNNTTSSNRPNPAQAFTNLPSVPSPTSPGTPIPPVPESLRQQLNTPPALSRAQTIPNSVIVRINQQTNSSVIPARTNIDSSLPPISFRPPAGEPVNQPIVLAPPSSSERITTPPRFRVVVPISSETSTDRIRKVVPNAFPSRHNGSLVVQVGAYSDRKLADVQVQNLARAGFTARIELINP